MKVKHTVRTASLALSFLLLAQVGTPRQPVVMTLVVDRSGSMSPAAPIGTCQSGTQGGLYLPAAVTNFITPFDESIDQVAVVTFATSSSNDVRMTHSFKTGNPNVITTINRIANNALWAGATCTMAGLTNALVIQNSINTLNAIKVVVLFTDGQANAITATLPTTPAGGITLNFGGNSPPQVGCIGVNPGASFWRTNAAETVTAQNAALATATCGGPVTFTVGGTNVSTTTYTDSTGTHLFCASSITLDATNHCVLIANQLRASSNYVYAVGLVGDPNGAGQPNLTTLQEIANDPNSSTFNPTQPVGAAFLTTGTNLLSVMQQIATDILTVPPWIICPSNVTVNTDPGGCAAHNVNLGTPLLSPPCSGPLYLTNNAPAVFSKGTTLVVWTAVDSCNNETACTQSVTVVDNQLPIILCPTSLVVSCASAVPSPDPSSIKAVDNCGSVTVTFVGDTIVDQLCPDRYAVLRTYRATDAASNSVTCTQTIVVNNFTHPTITAPADVAISTDSGQCYASGVALGSPVTSSPCGGTLIITSNAPAVFPKGSTQVIWSATDFCGNNSSATQNVLVADNQPPLTACPSNILVNAQNSNGAVVAFSVTASDNCDSNLVASCSPVSGSQFAIGTTPVNCVVVDAAGNTNTCSFSVTVVDPSIFNILSITTQNSDILLSWVMPLGLTGIVQGSADNYGDDFTNVSAPFYTPGTGAVTNTYVDPGGQTNFLQRFYRIRLTP